MMVCFMPALKKLSIGLIGGLCWLCFALAGANHAHIKSAEMVLRDEVWTLDAELDVQLGQSLELALSKGVMLTFLYEFQLIKPMKYWFDDEVLTKRRVYTLSYHALTKQYLLQTEQQQKAFDSLNDAKQVLGSIREWRLAPHAVIEKNQPYQAALKMHLDQSKLPKALQVDAYGESDWELVTPTFDWWIKESVR